MMTGDATSLRVLAEIANAYRTVHQVQTTMAAISSPAGRVAIPPPSYAVVHRTPLQVQTGTMAMMSSTPGKVVIPPTTTKHAVVKQTATPPAATPKQYLQKLFAQEEIAASHIPKIFSRDDFVKPDEEEHKDYNQAARLVRTNDLEKLRALHKEGKNLDACNRVGESLLHLACRRGHVAIAKFLMVEAKVRWNVQDDFGRTILHDACWRPSPSIELMDAILKVVSPEWLLAPDVRGHTPFDYARREHAVAWYAFLTKREDMLKRRLSLLF